MTFYLPFNLKIFFDFFLFFCLLYWLWSNYCIAGHNSTIYAEIFNDLDQIQIGDEMYLIDNDENRTRYTYIVAEYQIVDPSSVEVLEDYGDDRLTVISCTDDGENRQVVTGILEWYTYKIKWKQQSAISQ